VAPKQFDLDHHMAYAWRIGGVDLSGKTITSATLTFRTSATGTPTRTCCSSTCSNTAKAAGVSSFQDAPANQVPVIDINDDFAGSRYLNKSAGCFGD